MPKKKKPSRSKRKPVMSGPSRRGSGASARAESANRRKSGAAGSRASKRTPKTDVGTKPTPPGPAPTVSGPDIRALRDSLYLKQIHFAALLNVDSMTLSRWERGLFVPRPWHCELLAVFKRALGAGFSWCRKTHYWRARYEVALDEPFEPWKIPDRLREILVAAHNAAKPKDVDKP